MLIKVYETTQEETHYSPAKCTGSEIKSISENPDPKYVSTSYVEPQNLTMRISMRRITEKNRIFWQTFLNSASP
jgi:hypothetical protein